MISGSTRSINTVQTALLLSWLAANLTCEAACRIYYHMLKGWLFQKPSELIGFSNVLHSLATMSISYSSRPFGWLSSQGDSGGGREMTQGKCQGNTVKLYKTLIIQVSIRIVASTHACHAWDRSSILRWRVFFFWSFLLSLKRRFLIHFILAMDVVTFEPNQILCFESTFHSSLITLFRTWIGWEWCFLSTSSMSPLNYQ